MILKLPSITQRVPSGCNECLYNELNKTKGPKRARKHKHSKHAGLARCHGYSHQQLTVFNQNIPFTSSSLIHLRQSLSFFAFAAFPPLIVSFQQLVCNTFFFKKPTQPCLFGRITNIISNVGINVYGLVIVILCRPTCNSSQMNSQTT